MLWAGGIHGKNFPTVSFWKTYSVDSMWKRPTQKYVKKLTSVFHARKVYGGRWTVCAYRKKHIIFNLLKPSGKAPLGCRGNGMGCA